MQSMTAPSGAPRPDLLMELIRNPLDPGYAAAAQRHQGTGFTAGARGGWSRALTAAGAFLIGLLLVMAYLHERRTAPQQAALRDELAAQVQAAEKQNADLQSEAQALADQVRQARDAANPADSAAAALSVLEIASGDRAVRGPGVVVTLADPPATTTSDSSGSSSDRSGIPGSYPASLIGDRELRDVVNALWIGGAEAIGINGVRLTATSAIRFAGEVVLVDFRPITSPYVISAIGDPAGLEVSFAGGDVGARLHTLDSVGRLSYSIRTENSISLPAAVQAAPIYGRPLDAASAPAASRPAPPPAPASTEPTPTPSPTEGTTR